MRVRDRGFTLVEILVVAAITAILGTTLLSLINPSELLKRARDSQRLSDLTTIDQNLQIYALNNPGGMGSTSVVYVSTPDPTATTTAGTHCEGLTGLPSLPAPWVYRCASPNAYKNTDGAGWIPLNLLAVASQGVVHVLPADPKNSTSSGYLYSYTTDGSNYELSAGLESVKYSSNAQNDNGKYADLYERGKNLTLLPVDFLSPNNFSLGTSQSVSITVAGTTSTLSFAGTAGQVIDIVISGYTLTTGFGRTTFVSLLNPDSTTVSSASVTDNNTSVTMGPFTLGTTGNYSIVISPQAVAGTGNITIGAYAFPNTNPTASIAMGGYQRGAAASTGQQSTYNFTGTSGQPLNFIYSGYTFATGFSRTTQVYLFAPNGSLATSATLSDQNNSVRAGPFTPSISGTYTFVLSPSGGSGTGGLTMGVYDSPDSNPAATLTLGNNLRSAVTSDTGQQFAYTFTGNTTQPLDAIFSGYTFPMNFSRATAVYLFAPDGSLATSTSLTDQNNTQKFGTYTPIMNGTYTLVFAPGGTSGTGAVTTNIYGFPVNNPSATITTSTPLTASVGTTGQQFSYNFAGTATQNASFTFTGYSFVTGFGRDTQAYLYNSDGTLGTSVTLSGNGSLGPYTLPSTATYTLIFAPSGIVGTGNVTITLFQN